MRHMRLYPEDNLHARIAHDIGREIVAGTIPEGSVLPREAELSERYDASRQAVREGLKVLAAKGLIAPRRHLGSHVLPREAWNLLDPDILAWHHRDLIPRSFLRDLVELRGLVEPAAAEFAARRGDSEAVAMMGAAIEGMRANAPRGDAFVAADTAFHIALCRASGNVLIDRMSALCAPLLAPSLQLQEEVRPPERVDEIIRMHADVYERIVARDPEAARAAMQALVDRAAIEIMAVIRRDSDGE